MKARTNLQRRHSARHQATARKKVASQKQSDSPAKEADTIELSFAKKRSRLEQWITAVTGGNQTTNEEEHPPGGPCPDPDAPTSGTSTFIPGDTPTRGIAVNPFQKGPMAGGGHGPDPSPHEK